MIGSIPNVILTLAAIISAAIVAGAIRWRRGQSLDGRFFLVFAGLIAAAIVISVFTDDLAALSPHLLGRVLATTLFTGATFLGWYTYRTWQVQGWSPLVRQLAFTALTAVASAIACLYFL